VHYGTALMTTIGVIAADEVPRLFKPVRSCCRATSLTEASVSIL